MSPRVSDPQIQVVSKALLITDLVDSTELFGRLGDQRAAQVSARHGREARDLLAGHRGREIDKADGFLLAFDHPRDALGYALAYHQRLAELADELGVPLNARVGIHQGKVYLRANAPEDIARGAKPVEIEGVAKPIAARVMSLAGPRQTLLTRDAFEGARAAVARPAGGRSAGEEGDLGGPEGPGGAPRDLRWLAHGPYLLKGIDRPVEIFEVGREGFAPLEPPDSSGKGRRAVEAGDEITLGWRPAPDLAIPRRPGWVLTERLGSGGFGEVWLARRAAPETGPQTAPRTTPRTNSEAPGPGDDDQRVFKFCYHADRLRSLQREVTLFRLLKESLGDRQDISKILSWNFDQAPYYIESEHTEGGNLAEWAEARGGADQIPMGLRLELMAQVAEALAAAHSVGVLHKDIKPSNILVTEDDTGAPRARLTDFGIGMVTDREILARRGITAYDLTEIAFDPSNPSRSGSMLYTAPELIEGKAPSIQADLYALGVVLYQFVRGEFHRPLAPGWRRWVEDELLEEDIAELVDGSPERRPRSASEVAERLRTLELRRRRREAQEQARREAVAGRLALEQAQRRRRTSAAVALAALVVLVIVSAFALQASRARQEAERRRSQAEGIIGFMLGDLREKLQPLGQLAILEDVGDRAQTYFAAIPEDQLSDQERFRKMESLLQVAEIQVDLGHLPTAHDLYLQAVDQGRLLVEREPQRTEWLASLGTAHFGVGSVRWYQGDPDEALSRFEAYREVAERLLELEPTEPRWLLELAYARSSIGSVLESRGQMEEAQGEFESSLATRQTLVSQDPGNLTWRRDLAIAHNKMGNLLAARGDLTAALSHFREDLSLQQSLSADAPGDQELREHLATSHNYVGNFYRTTGRTDAALAHLEAAVEITANLAGRDPANSRWQREHAVNRLALAGLLITWGDLANAETQLAVTDQIFRQLSHQDPTNVTWQQDVVNLELRFAELALARRRGAESRRHLLEARALLASRLAEDREDRQARRLLSRSHLIEGRSWQLDRDPGRARESFRRSVEIIEPIARGSDNYRLVALWASGLLYLDRTQEARPLVAQLLRAGYRHAPFVELCQQHDLLPETLLSEPPRSETGALATGPTLSDTVLAALPVELAILPRPPLPTRGA